MRKRVLILNQYLYDLIHGHCWAKWKQHYMFPHWKERHCSRCHKHQIEWCKDASGESIMFESQKENGGK